MIFSEIFKYYLISFEKSNEEEIKSLCDKIDSIKIHNLLNSKKELIDRLKFVIVVYDKEDPLSDFSLNVFLRKFDHEEKRYSDKDAFYLFTIFLNEEFDCKYDLNIDNENIEQVTDDDFSISNIHIEIDERNLDFSQTNIEKNYYVSNDEIFAENEILNMLDDQVYNVLINLRTGYYFNIKDITWQFLMKQVISSNEYFYINYHSSKFKMLTLIDSFFPNINLHSKIETNSLKYFKFVCSYCNQTVSEYYSNYDKMINTYIYFNSHNGCLCHSCYLDLKKNEEERKKHFKKIILNEGKKIVFSKDLIKTQLFLKKHKSKKFDKNKKLVFYEKIIRSLVKNKKKTDCPICLDELNENISSGSCGHCYHTECIKNYKEECPVCRKKTKFIKLFL